MSIGKKYICSAANGRQAAILSDGTVVCSCYDKSKDLSLGSIYTNSFMEIWNGAGYTGLCNNVAKGILPSRYCNRCHFLIETDSLPMRTNGPQKLIIEYNSDCVLNCPGCERDEIENSREELKMSKFLVNKILDELPEIPNLKKIGFFNHGEPFIYDEAFSFIKEIKKAVPNVDIFTSTNGLMIDSDNRLEALISSGIDTVLFSIDGSDEEGYAKYRVGGSFAKTLSNMKRLINMKKALGIEKPFIIWRYIIFNWNDSDSDINRAISLASDIGVDKLCFLPTNYPAWGVSTKYSQGGQGTIIEPYLDNVF